MKAHMSHAAQPPFWSQPLPALLAALGTDSAGLDAAGAALRLRAHGPNTIRPRRERAVLLQFAARFRNPLIVTLLGAAAITAFVGDVTSFVMIAGIVLLSVALDFIQEYLAGSAAERLRRTVALHATVVREGSAREMPAAQIVPGDILLLAPGDLVAADARLIEARDFFVNQAFLTGESYPVEKHAGDAAADTLPGQAANAVFTGTSVISGSAKALVTATGRDTMFGHIGASLQAAPPATAFVRGTAAFGMLIMRVTVLLVLFVLLVNVLLHRPLLESFLFAVALAVGLTPELLPMVVSVTLARGALRMADKRVIVKRLSAVQDLGGIDVLCTDKTGTLTEGRIRLERHCDMAGTERARVLELAYLNSHFETGLRSPLDTAILQHTEIPAANWRKVDEVPFDFERRRVSVLLAGDDARMLIVKGAPEDVLRLCTHYEAHESDTVLPLDEAARDRAAALYRSLSAGGYRALAIAWRTVPPEHDHAVVTDETALVFSGYAAFLDPPKAGAAAALSSLAACGIAIKIVTGDNELVTRHVCKALDFPVTGLLTGPEMHELDDAALQARAGQTNVYCRVTPAQKARLLAALKARGHVVGFLGDGINDAPSLHAADVGISVADAVDVAKEAADLILLEQDLGVLRDGVREGRRTFVNVMKYIMMATSSNFGNMFSMAAATLVVPFLPLLPVQVLLNNLLYDLSELALPFDRVDDEALARPCVWDMTYVRRSMLAFGPVSSLFDFLTFAVLLGVLHAGEAAFRTGWFVESIVTQVLVIFVIRTRKPAYASRPDPRLAAAALAVVTFAVLLPFVPYAGLLGFVTLPPLYYLVIVCIALAYLLAAELTKRAFYGRWAGGVSRRPESA